MRGTLNIVPKIGSATSPTPTADAGVIIMHICNNKGGWGAGFVKALNSLSLVARSAYRALAGEYGGGRGGQPATIPIGTLQMVEVKPNIWVANMVVQDGMDKRSEHENLVNYSALSQCMAVVLRRALQLGCDVHMPEGMGSGLAGGEKAIIHQLVQEAGRVALTSVDDDDASLTITMWEFQDKTADSYVGTPDEEALGTTSPADAGAAIAALPDDAGKVVDVTDQIGTT